MKHSFVIALAALAMTCAARGGDVWVEVADGEMDVRAATPRASQVLAMDDIHWRHAQTDHFVIHYEQAIFARKVARMAEFLYDYIAADLKDVEDRVAGRSHIFIFRSGKRWDQFLETVPDVPEWSFSQVSGTAMFLQQAFTISSSSHILAHEMTHMVMNRFYRGRAPLWLDEGLAEYYGQFGYSAFKGTKKSRRAQFTRLADPYPLTDVLYAVAYPREDWQVEAFYETAKYLVGFLLLDRPPEKFLPFMEDLMAGRDVIETFGAHYGLDSLEAIEKEFHKFAF